MKRKRIKILATSIAFSLTTCFAVGTSLTIANYVNIDGVDQTVYSHGGEMKVSIFFDPGTAWDLTHTEVYYLHCYSSSSAAVEDILPTKSIYVTLTGDQTGSRTLYVFEYNTTKFNKMVFVRCNPTDLDPSDIWSNEWGKSYNKTQNDSYNYYKMTSYVENSTYTHNSRGYINTSSNISSFAADTEGEPN